MIPITDALIHTAKEAFIHSTIKENRKCLKESLDTLPLDFLLTQYILVFLLHEEPHTVLKNRL